MSTEPDTVQDAPQPQGPVRRSRKLQFRATNVDVVATHPGGTIGRLKVCTETLDANTMTFLNGGYLHVGTSCEVLLKTLNGEQCTLLGHVTACEHKHQRIHKVDLIFEYPIDPAEFIPRAELPVGSRMRSGPRRELNGHVLYLDDQEMDRDLLTLHLSETGIKLATVAKRGQAMDQIRQQQFDLVIVDLNLGQTRGEEVIRAMRDGGFDRPIAVLTVESSSSRMQQAKEAGADAILQKPFDPDELLEQLAGLLDEANRQSQVIISSLPFSRANHHAVKKYIDKVDDAMKRMNLAVKQDDYHGVREICLTLKATGTGYGFAALSECAQQAIIALDSSFSAQESRKELRDLETLTHRLRPMSPGSDGG